MVAAREAPGCYVGIDLGGTFIKSVLLDSSGKAETFLKEPTRKGDQAALVEQIAGVIQKLSEHCGRDTIRAVGLGVPGNVDGRTKEILSSPNLKFTEGLRIREALSTTIDVPFAVDNDANAGALGEHRFGAGRGTRNMVFLALGTGVGGGLILEGQPFRGSRGYGAELGHTNVNPDGRACLCGGIGCLETEVAAPAVVRKAKEFLEAGTESKLQEIEGREITAEDVGLMAAGGDRVCIEILERMGRMLGIALADFVNIFNPDMIVIGGGISECRDLLLKPAVKEASRRAFPSPFAHCQFRIAELKEKAGAMGAAAMAMESTRQG